MQKNLLVFLKKYITIRYLPVGSTDLNIKKSKQAIGLCVYLLAIRFYKKY
jgi:hypothetical protein